MSLNKEIGNVVLAVAKEREAEAIALKAKGCGFFQKHKHPENRHF